MRRNPKPVARRKLLAGIEIGKAERPLDNDLAATGVTFGFNTAVETATEFEGVYDLMKLWINESEAKERDEIVVKGGHVSVVAGPAAVTRLWPSIDQWLGKRSI